MDTNYNDVHSVIDGEPVLTRTYADGEKHTLTGTDALANGNDAESKAWQAENPYSTFVRKHQQDAMGDTTSFQWGKQLRGWLDNPNNKTFLGRLMDQGTGTAALTGGGIGLLGGLLANAIGSGLGVQNPHFGILGALAGAGLGGLIGHERQMAKESSVKEATMYMDPRNFILEKLQGAHDIGLAEKAQLAFRVRNMDRVTAQRLADAVRAAVGAGVGALIAKFFGIGMGFGAMSGLLGVAAIKALTTPRLF